MSIKKIEGIKMMSPKKNELSIDRICHFERETIEKSHPNWFTQRGFLLLAKMTRNT